MIRTSEGKLRHTGCERLKCSWWQKGKPKGPQSPELILKRANSIRGLKRSMECRNKMSLARKGKIPHNKGKTKLNYAPLQAVSEKMLGNKNPEGRFGSLNGMFGKKAPWLKAYRKLHAGEPLSESHKRKIGENSRRYWADPIKRAKSIKSLSKVWCKHLEMTYLEKMFFWLCEEYGLPFRYVGNGQVWITSCGIHINPDFIDIFGRHIVVEVYARCWKQSDYETVRETLLKSAGFRVIFLDDTFFKGKDWKEKCLNQLKGTEQDLAFI